MNNNDPRRARPVAIDRPHIMRRPNGWRVFCMRAYRADPANATTLNAAFAYCERMNWEALQAILDAR